MTVTIFSARDCALCSQLTQMLRSMQVPFQVSWVNSKDAPALAERFPQMKYEQGLFGLALPFGAVGDDLIGGYDDIVRECIPVSALEPAAATEARHD